MLRLFQHHISLATLAELLADSLTSFLAVVLGTLTLVHLSGSEDVGMAPALRSGLGFALLIPLHCGLVGVYREGSQRKTAKEKLGRAVLGCLLAAPIAYQLAVKTEVAGDQAHQLMGFVAAYLVIGLILVRGLLLSAWRGALVQQRVLIIGTGSEAQSVATDRRSRRLRSHAVVGFYPAGDVNVPTDDKRFNIFPRALAIQDIVQR